jgi:hypothetical protein
MSALCEWSRKLARESEFPPLAAGDGIGPAGSHLTEWFTDLAATREITVVAGMGGGAVIPKAIGHQEIAAWAELTDTHPLPWEVKTLRAMDAAYLSEQGGKGHGKKHQAVGDYCDGADLENCRRMFGGQLERVCSTCPE